MNREQMIKEHKFSYVYKHMHRDFKVTIDGVKHFVICLNGITTLVNSETISDERLEKEYGYYANK